MNIKSAFRYITSAALLSMLAFPSTSSAQEGLDQGNTSIIVHTGAGGPLDTLARRTAELLSLNMGWSVIVENRQGGNGAVALSHLLTQPADGHSILGVTKSLSNNFALDRLNSSLDDIGFLTTVQAEPSAVFVRSDSPLESLDDYVSALAEEPNGLRIGGSGQGGNDFVHFLINENAGIESVWVPFDTAPEAVVALQGGHIDVAILSPSSALSQLATGDFRILAVSSGERSPSYPDVPTLQESGLDIDDVLWRGFVVKAGTPPEVEAALLEAFATIQQSEQWAQMMSEQNQEPFERTGEDFQAMVATEIENLRAYYQASGLVD